MRYKQWKIAHPSPEGRAQLELAGIPSLLACVLSARGVTEPEQAWKLLTPGEEPLLDPMLLKDMDRAVLRVGRALKTGELMAVYGDYDVDGITSTCLLTDCLTRLGGRVRSYIPDRLEEGYGLNQEAVLHLARQGVTLIITVDCGITAAWEVEFARELGIDVVITDHHECKQAIPEAAAVVDPHRPDCPYPFKGLAGVGVALKLAMAAAGPDRAGLVFREYADLAAVGTVADVMPMTGENRTIVQTGLAALAHPRRVGLAQLMEEAGLGDKPVTSVSIGYTLAPRINAAGRMGQADLAAELLLTRDPGRAAALAQELCALNRERQTTILISSHILSELSTLATHYAFIEKGRVLESVSADRLREKCRECLELTVDDAARAARVLEEQLGTRDFEVLPHNKLRLYTFLDQPQTVNRVLLENGVGLISAQQRSSDLEDYFLSLIGGRHAAGKEGF